MIRCLESIHIDETKMGIALRSEVHIFMSDMKPDITYIVQLSNIRISDIALGKPRPKSIPCYFGVPVKHDTELGTYSRYRYVTVPSEDYFIAVLSDTVSELYSRHEKIDTRFNRFYFRMFEEICHGWNFLRNEECKNSYGMYQPYIPMI